MPDQAATTRLILWLRGQDPDREPGYPFDVPADQVDSLLACLDGRTHAEFFGFATSDGAAYIRAIDISVVKVLGWEIGR